MSDMPGQWYRLSPEEALEQVDSQPEGLDDHEAGRRREQHGPNRIREQEQVSAWRIVLEQLTDPLIYVLIAALGATLVIGNVADAIVIGAVLVINTTIGFIQEYQAESAVQSLMEMVSPKARVRRSGDTQEIDAQDLVPGDVVLVGQGLVVPADLRLLDVTGLQVDEAPLTGESVPVNKHSDALEEDEEQLPPADQTCMAFMGTAVTSGEAEGLVVATGPDTQIGQIAEQVQEAERVETPLQARIDRLAKWIAGAILGVAALAFAVGLLLGYDVEQMLLLAVALAVAAIPAGLPVVVTVALAVGVRRMARRHAVIRNLPAVDTLGSCTVIVSDKTGTLTQNRMTVRTVTAGDERFEFTDGGEGSRSAIERDGEPIDPGEQSALHETLLVGVLCNEAQLPHDEEEASGDPMEVALLAAGRTAGMAREELAQRYPLRETVPFRTEQKFMATIHADAESDDDPLVLVKGAPERLVEMCDRRRTTDGGEEPLDRDATIAQSEALAQEGLRVLAMAVGRGDDTAQQVHGENPSGFVLVGMQGLLDPPRDQAIDAVDRCHDAGIRVVMVTGDHATTAAAIGQQVHVGRPGRRADPDDPLETRRGPELAELDDTDLDDVLARVDVFARVAPGQKLRLVERLQAQEEIVAVTGDGVNDAPALEAAHIGAAMGSGTDVAKEASDMVVTDDNFASVYAAVEEGRTAFRNIRMATFFLLSTGAADILIIVAALGLRWPLPLLPAQILWVNVVTNGIADVALAFEPGERALFRRPPRPVGEGVLHRRLIERLVIVGVWLSAGTLAVFWWQWGGESQNLGVARTAAVTTMVLFQKVHVFNCRSEQQSVFAKGLLANKVLFVGVLASLAVHVGALYLPLTQRLLRFEPLDLATWVVAALVASTAIVINEMHKRLRAPQPSVKAC